MLRFLLISLLLLRMPLVLAAENDCPDCPRTATGQILEQSPLSGKSARDLTQQFRCPGYELERRHVNFSKYNPAASVIHRIQLPRTERTFYRGIEDSSPQLTPASGIAAMLGDESKAVGSFFFSEIKNILLGLRTIASSPLKAQIEASEAPKYLAMLHECGTMNEDDATRYAMDILDKLFARHDRAGDTLETYLDQRSKKFQDFPREAVYGTVYPTVAGWYGKKVLLYRENTPRSVDHHYWELKNAGRAFETQPLLDSGEILTPGYIPSNDVDGFWIKTTEQRLMENHAAYSSGHSTPIAFGFQKIIVRGEPYVVVLDGEDRTHCITRSEDGRFIGCDLNYSHPGQSGLKPFPVPKPEQEIPVIGLIRLCRDRGPCALPPDVAKMFTKKSDRPLPADLAQAVRTVATATGTAAWFPLNSKKPAIRAEKPEIIRLDVGNRFAGIPSGNVTAQAGEFCDGKSHCRYKISTKFLNDPAPGMPKSFDLKWKCSGDDTVKSVAFKEGEAEGKLFDLSCPKHSMIEVTEATFGGNLKPRNPQDLTVEAKYYCEGRAECLIPDGLHPGQKLSVEYRCPSKPGETLKTEGGRGVIVKCPAASD